LYALENKGASFARRANKKRPRSLTVAIITAPTAKVKNLLDFFRKTCSSPSWPRWIGEVAGNASSLTALRGGEV
jgi:hypothetical protein